MFLVAGFQPQVFWKDFCPGFLLFKGQILLGAACNELGASSSRSEERDGECFLLWKLDLIKINGFGSPNIPHLLL